MERTVYHISKSAANKSIKNGTGRKTKGIISLINGVLNFFLWIRLRIAINKFKHIKVLFEINS